MPDTGDPELDPLRERYNRNRDWAKRGSYQTKLSPGLEQEFQGWLYKNQIPYDRSADQSTQDYDMRGFFKAMKSGDPKAARDPQTGHFPDAWKTPYHETFSNQSVYATGDAPKWKDGTLVDKSGNVVWKPRLTPGEAEQGVREDLDPEMQSLEMGRRRGYAMREVDPVTSDYGGLSKPRNALLSPEEVRYWSLYGQGLIGPQVTGPGVMNEAQRVAPMPAPQAGVATPQPEYSAWFLNPDAWNDYASRRAYEALGR